MVKEFFSIFEYPVKIVMGKSSLVIQYHEACQLIKPMIAGDNQLVRLHQNRLGPQDYADSPLTILTQYVIYAATVHLRGVTKATASCVKIDLVDQSIESRTITPSLQASVVNWLENQQAAKHIGDIGEYMILRYEQQKLHDWGIFDLKPELVATTKGDGLGYDIESYSRDRTAIYIEVKSTLRSWGAAFYISAPELLCSNKNKGKYYLYRLFNIDPIRQTGKLIVRKGSLAPLCINPTSFIVATSSSPSDEI